MTERIRWEPTKHRGWTGHVGTIDGFVFQVWKPAPFGEKPYRLESSLPGGFGRVADGTDPDDLKAEAERRLAEFTSHLGAIFPAEPAKSRKSRAWHADWAEVDRDQGGNAILKHKPSGGLYRILPVEES